MEYPTPIQLPEDANSDTSPKSAESKHPTLVTSIQLRGQNMQLVTDVYPNSQQNFARAISIILAASARCESNYSPPPA